MKQTILTVLLALTLVLAACGAQATPAPPEPTQAPTDPTPTSAPAQPPATPEPTAETFVSPPDMSNPASKFCAEQGYQLEIRDEADGQVGYCLFPDGSECEEWAFYRGECQPGTTFRSPIGIPNPAAVFCEEQGYTYEIRDETAGQVGYCLFPDGSECDAWAFLQGDCQPGAQKSQ